MLKNYSFVNKYRLYIYKQRIFKLLQTNKSLFVLYYFIKYWTLTVWYNLYHSLYISFPKLQFSTNQRVKNFGFVLKGLYVASTAISPPTYPNLCTSGVAAKKRSYYLLQTIHPRYTQGILVGSDWLTYKIHYL